MTLSERARQLLKDRDWSQAHLAQASGLDPLVVSRLLAGERPWRKEHLACVAAALSTTPEELIKGTDTAVDDDAEIDNAGICALHVRPLSRPADVLLQVVLLQERRELLSEMALV